MPSLKTEKLYPLQQAIDERMDFVDNRFNYTLFAFKTELYELANKIEFFKFWKNHKGKDGRLEEYVDGLHFLLSLGLQARLTPKEIRTDKALKSLSYLAIFTQIEYALNQFIYYRTLKSYETLFEYFLELGIKLGYNMEQIEDAYYKKNLINHERQDAGY